LVTFISGLSRVDLYTFSWVTRSIVGPSSRILLPTDRCAVCADLVLVRDVDTRTSVRAEI